MEIKQSSCDQNVKSHRLRMIDRKESIGKRVSGGIVGSLT
jgi:hypothetical protein